MIVYQLSVSLIKEQRDAREAHLFRGGLLHSKAGVPTKLNTSSTYSTPVTVILLHPRQDILTTKQYPSS